MTNEELGCWYCHGSLESIADAETETSQEFVKTVYACNECGARYLACYDPIQDDK